MHLRQALSKSTTLAAPCHTKPDDTRLQPSTSMTVSTASSHTISVRVANASCLNLHQAHTHTHCTPSSSRTSLGDSLFSLYPFFARLASASDPRKRRAVTPMASSIGRKAQQRASLALLCCWRNAWARRLLLVTRRGHASHARARHWRSGDSGAMCKRKRLVHERSRLLHCRCSRGWGRSRGRGWGWGWDCDWSWCQGHDRRFQSGHDGSTWHLRWHLLRRGAAAAARSSWPRRQSRHLDRSSWAHCRSACHCHTTDTSASCQQCRIPLIIAFDVSLVFVAVACCSFSPRLQHREHHEP